MPPTTTFNSLPEAVLARILDLAPPSLDLLLVCKLWHRIALEHGLAHWHTMCLCGASPQTMRAAGSQGAVAALLRGFDRLAPHVRRLCIDARDRGGPLGVQPVLPQLLLAAGRRAAQLEQLELDTGEAQRELLRATLEALGMLTQLHGLSLAVNCTLTSPAIPAPSPRSPFPLELLAPLRALRQLRSLELKSVGQVGHLPLGLLSGLTHLTRLAVHLGVYFGDHAFHEIAWGGGAGGPALRALQLGGCCAAAAELAPASLRALESLEVAFGGVSRQLFQVLPQLPRLTRLDLRGPKAGSFVAWDVLAQTAALDALWECGQLRELVLLSLAGPGPPDSWAGAVVPPGALAQLTLLEMDAGVWTWPLGPVWWVLSTLRTLKLRSFGAQALPSVGLNQLQALEDLDLDLCDCGGVTPALAALGQLTRLRMSEANFFQQEAPPGAYLGRLRQLVVTGSPSLDRTASWQLPAVLEGATCLEQLDLALAEHLILRGAEDAALLSRLPALRQVVLPLLQGRYAWHYSPRAEARQAAAAQALRRGLPGVEVVTSNGAF